MNILLDTHAFLWWDWQYRDLSNTAVNAMQNPQNTLLLSVVSVQELQIKVIAQRLLLGSSVEDLVTSHQESGVVILPLTLKHIYTLTQLPFYDDHKDPFDRQLIAQALYEGLPIITNDPKFKRYPITIIW